MILNAPFFCGALLYGHAVAINLKSTECALIKKIFIAAGPQVSQAIPIGFKTSTG